MKTLIACLVMTSASVAWAEDQEREGFTMILDVGLARQTLSPDEGDSKSSLGLAGLNLGLGGFIRPDLAVMFRLMGSNVTHTESSLDVEVISGVGGIGVQYWPSEHVNIEVGGGFGIANTVVGANEDDEKGFGAMAGINVPLWSNAGNVLHVGAQFAPVFLDDGAVYNANLVFGWQLL